MASTYIVTPHLEFQNNKVTFDTVVFESSFHTLFQLRNGDETKT